MNLSIIVLKCRELLENIKNMLKNNYDPRIFEIYIDISNILNEILKEVDNGKK